MLLEIDCSCATSYCLPQFASPSTKWAQPARVLAPADIGEAAFGRRLGRRPVLFFTRAITLCLPSIMHVGGTRFLQASWVWLGRRFP